MTETLKGQLVGGKAINLVQLKTELAAAGVAVEPGLGITADYVHAYDSEGVPADFPEASRPTVDQVIAAHVAMRDKTSEEYAAEFQAAGTTAARKQEIRDIQNGLLPPEQVPMETPA
jgi:hypothetical protein